MMSACLKRIGLYGISCCGKSTLLKGVKQAGYACVDFSDCIVELSSSLKHFQTLPKEEQVRIRKEAITKLASLDNNVIIVSNHFSLAKISFEGGALQFEDVFGEDDASFYTHIIYVDAPAAVISKRDELKSPGSTGTRKHPKLSVEQIQAWLDHEKAGLMRVCGGGSPIQLHLFESAVDKEGFGGEELLELVNKIASRK